MKSRYPANRTVPHPAGATRPGLHTVLSFFYPAPPKYIPMVLPLVLDIVLNFDQYLPQILASTGPGPTCSSSSSSSARQGLLSPRTSRATRSSSLPVHSPVQAT